MIITLSLNPSVDTYYQIPNLQYGQVNRPTNIVKSAGGKGNNVARILSILGSYNPIIATGYIGGLNGQIIKSDMDNNKIKTDYRNVSTETRSCIIIDDGHEQTNINEVYNVYDESEQQFSWSKKLLMAFDAGHVESVDDYLVLAGSLPNDYPSNAYQNILLSIHQHRPDIKIIVDSSGEAFRLAVNSGMPIEFIKPNVEELTELLNTDLTNENSIENVIRQHETLSNVKNLLVSNGHKNAYARFNGSMYRITPPTINAVNATGSGDASLAGVLYGLTNKLTTKETLKIAMACGADNALHSKSGTIILKSMKDLSHHVIIELI